MGKVYAQIPEGCTFDDVVDTLAANGGTGMKSSDASSLFTKEALNNGIFSLRKPIRLQNNPFPTGEYWLGTETEPCGFSIVNARATSIQELVGKYDGDMNGWKYLAPRGDDTPTGSIEHYRIHDFHGFYPTAMPMSKGFSMKTRLTQKDTSDTAYIAHNMDDGRSLTWADFPKLKDYYFGVAFYNNDVTLSALAATATTDLKSGGNSVEIDPSNLLLRTYQVCPFISSHKITWNTALPEGCEMYAIPKENVLIVTVVDSFLSIKVTAQRVVTSASLSVNWEVTVSNSSDNTYTLENNHIRVGNTINEETPSVNEKEVEISTAEIAANAVEQSIGSGTITLDQDFYTMMTEAERKTVNLWALVTLQGGNETVYQQIPADLSAGPKTL